MITTNQLGIFKKLSNWQDRYKQIIKLANLCPTLNDNEKTTENLIDGCESNLWIDYTINQDGTLSFKGDSEGRVTKGLLTIIIIYANHKTANQLIKYDFIDELTKLNIIYELSESKQLGINKIIERIKLIAQNHQ